MKERLSVCLLNDSFPPVLDGVANTVVNYADVIQRKYGSAVVATPSYPDVVDHYDFPVLRYPSFDTTKTWGYRTGMPFNPITVKELNSYKPDIIHSHCPVASTLLARSLRTVAKAPIVMTYHTKFDIEVAKAIRLGFVQSAAIKMMIRNINACDEIWVVSHGSGENLRSLGYTGDFVVMGNGVDFPREQAAQKEIDAICHRHSLTSDVPVFLFVGRMMWYKGVRIILDGLNKVKAQGLQFKMIFIGDGSECEEIKAYAASLNLLDCCIFTGAISDRQILRAYYSMCEMFLFPSTFDNRPIVVLEAAACGLPSMLIRGSSSAEGMTDGRQGILIEENADSLAVAVAEVIKDRTLAKIMGRYAMDELYISWEDAVAKAYERYFTIIENYKVMNAKKLQRRYIYSRISK